MAPPDLMQQEAPIKRSYMELVGFEDVPPSGFLEPDSYFATFMDALSHAQLPDSSSASAPDRHIAPLLAGAVKELDGFSRTYAKMAHEARVLSRLVMQMGENGAEGISSQREDHERVLREIKITRSELEAKCKMNSFDNCSLRHRLGLQMAKTNVAEEEARRLSRNNQLLTQQLRACESQTTQLKQEAEKYKRATQQSVKMETEKARGLIAALENDVASCRAREGAALQEVQQLKNERVQLQLERDRLAREMAELRAQVAREAADVKESAAAQLAKKLSDAKMEHAQQLEELRSQHKRQLEDLQTSLARESKEARALLDRELDTTRKALLAQLEERDATIAALRSKMETAERSAVQAEGRAMAAAERVRSLEERLTERREEAEEWRRQANTVQILSQSSAPQGPETTRLLYDRIAALEHRLRTELGAAGAGKTAPPPAPAQELVLTLSDPPAPEPTKKIRRAPPAPAPAPIPAPAPAPAPAPVAKRPSKDARKDAAFAAAVEEPPGRREVAEAAAAGAPAGARRPLRARAPGKSLAEPSTPLEIRSDSESSDMEDDTQDGGRSEYQPSEKPKRRKTERVTAAVAAPARIDLAAPYQPPETASTPAPKAAGGRGLGGPAAPKPAAPPPAGGGGMSTPSMKQQDATTAGEENAPGTVTRRRAAAAAAEALGAAEGTRQPLRALNGAGVAAAVASRKAADPPAAAVRAGLALAGSYVSGLKRPAVGEGGAPAPKRKLLKPNPTAHMDSLLLFGKGTAGFAVPKLNLPKRS